MLHIKENLKKTVRFNKEDDGELIGMPFPYTWEKYDGNTGRVANQDYNGIG